MEDLIGNFKGLGNLLDFRLPRIKEVVHSTVDILRLVVERGADIKYCVNSHGDTPIRVGMGPAHSGKAKLSPIKDKTCPCGKILVVHGKGVGYEALCGHGKREGS